LGGDRQRTAQAADTNQQEFRCTVFPAPPHHFQKKRICGQRSSTAPTWPRRVDAGCVKGMFDPARLVFIDETAVITKMVRLYGRRPRGVELIGRAPFGKWYTVTFVAALRHNKMAAPMVIEGAMNAQM